MSFERAGVVRLSRSGLDLEGDGLAVWLPAEDLPDLGESPLPVRGIRGALVPWFEDVGILDTVGAQARLLLVDTMTWYSIPLAQLRAVVAGTRRGAMISRWVRGGAPQGGI